MVRVLHLISFLPTSARKQQEKRPENALGTRHRREDNSVVRVGNNPTLCMEIKVSRSKFLSRIQLTRLWPPRRHPALS
jgi:hypothetical protein